MALSIVLLDLNRSLPAGPWLVTAFAAAWRFADICTAHVFVAIGAGVMGVVGVVVSFWIRFVAAFIKALP